MHIDVQDEDFAAVAIEDDLEQEEPDDNAGLDIPDEEKLLHLTKAVQVLDSFECSNSTRKEIFAAQRALSDSIHERKRQKVIQH